jgi:hypothetical protein
MCSFLKGLCMTTISGPSIILGNLRIFGGTADERHSLAERVRAFAVTMQGKELIAKAKDAARNMKAFCVIDD